MHFDCFRQVGIPILEGAKLENVTGFAAAGARGTLWL
jgi:hypothetical protein